MTDTGIPDTIPFDPRRFRSAAAHYLTGRTPYPARLIARVAEFCDLGVNNRMTGDRVMDLGCGPGQLAVAFAPYAREVVGIDPEPAMLAIARDTPNLPANIRFAEGHSGTLDEALGRFALVTIGRAFHWMDRPATIARLDAMIEPGGAIVLFHDDRPELPENEWRAEFDAVCERYGGGTTARSWRQAGWIRHEAVLLDSAFGELESVATIERRRFPAAQLVDRGLSLSATSPHRLGDAVDAFRREIAALAERIAVDGMVTEITRATALIARRS